MQSEYKITIPRIPTYSELRGVIAALDGESNILLKKLLRSVDSQRGTVNNPVNWSKPDEWMSARLNSEESRLASEIWNLSKKTSNPRYLRFKLNFINNHNLIDISSEGYFTLSKRSQDFLNSDFDLLYEIDNKEGITDLLEIAGVRKNFSIDEILDEWNEFMSNNFRYGLAVSSKEMLYTRLKNLVDREYLVKNKNKYHLTISGKEYLNRISSEDEGYYSKIDTFLYEHNESQKEKLMEMIKSMDPFLFEHLICKLLQEMGYDNVLVTKQTGDKGVDVIGDVQYGITTVREVVQVKRQKNNISRRIIDQLRGVLPYHEALRGTIITTSHFSKECEKAAQYRGAAPITLIDGDILIDLLVKYQVGIKKMKKEVFIIEDSFLHDD